MKYYCEVQGRELSYTFERHGDTLLALRDDGTKFQIDLSNVGDGNVFSLIVDGLSFDCMVERVSSGNRAVQMLGERIVIHVQDERERAAEQVAVARAGGKRTIDAAMPGVVVELQAAVGDVVEEGDTLLVLEAMKMQNPVQADGPGKVTAIRIDKGQAVSAGDPLIELDDA